MNNPKLRFKEFASDWKIDNLSDLSSIIDGDRGKNYPKEKDFFDDEFCLFLNAGNVTKLGFDFKNKLFITKEKDQSLRNGKLERNDIVLTTRGTVGNVVLYNSDIPFDNIRINSGMVIVRNKNKIIPEYLYSYMKSPMFESQVNKTNFGSAQPQLTIKGLAKFKVSYPEEKEQIKVSNFLSLLDKKIELQSKKIEDLKLFKKGLIHQMKKSSNNWSEYKISEIFKITRGVVIPKTDLLDNKTTEYQYPVYSSQTSNNGILGYDTKFDFDGKYLTWTTDGANAGKVFYRNGKFRCTNVCGVLYNDNNKYVDELTAELLNYETPKHVSYVGNPKLMNNVMGDIKIFLPDSNESDRVSNILLIINNKVLLETDKLNKLNKFKKGLMQNMFV